MKNKVMSLAALLIAAVFAFAFKAEPLKFFADQQFELVTGGLPNDPLDYVPFSGDEDAACPVEAQVCIIDVLNADVYTALDAPTSAHIGKPKVNQATLSSLITTALGSGQDPYMQPATGRQVWQREADAN